MTLSDYDLAVRLLNSRNTHLKLRERCRLALRQLARDARPLPDGFWDGVRVAMHRRQNAASYQQRHFPGWHDNIPEQLREQMLADYPLSGHGMADMNTMLYLERTAREAEAAIALPDPPDPEEAQIDQMVQDYLAYRQTLRPA